MLDEALRVEDVHLAYRDMAGTIFSQPRTIGFFRREETDPQKELFSNVNLVVNRGETVCIGGGSGQGKSALLRVIAGLIRPTRGNIFYFGEYIPPERLTAL